MGDDIALLVAVGHNQNEKVIEKSYRIAEPYAGTLRCSAPGQRNILRFSQQFVHAIMLESGPHEAKKTILHVDLDVLVRLIRQTPHSLMP